MTDHNLRAAVERARLLIDTASDEWGRGDGLAWVLDARATLRTLLAESVARQAIAALRYAGQDTTADLHAEGTP